MSEFPRKLRDTIGAATLAGLLVLGASCSSGSEGASPHPDEQVSTTLPHPDTTGPHEEVTTTTESVTDEEKEAFQCGLLEASMAVGAEQLEDKKPAHIAMGFRYYHEITNEDGVFGTEVLYNPAVTKCDLPSGNSLRVLTTQVVLGDKGIDGFEATGVAIIQFFPDKKKYGLRGETGRAAIETDKGSEAWGADGYLDYDYVGDDTQVGVEKTVLHGQDCLMARSCRAIVDDKTGVRVMWRQFYPNQTIEEVQEGPKGTPA